MPASAWMNSGCDRQFELQLDVFAEDAPQHFGHVGDGFVQIQIARLQHFLPAEQKQLAGQRGGALGGCANLIGKFRLRRGKIAAALQQVGLHLDDRQNVVEIMRHAAGQLADALHFLRLAELAFQFPLLGDVAKSPDSSVIFSGLVANGCRIAIQNQSVNQLNFIPADLVRMRIQVGDFIGKLLGILCPSGDKMNLRGIIFVFGNMRRNFPQIIHPLVLENFLSLAVHDQDAIKGGIHLCFQQGGFPSQIVPPHVCVP